MQKIHLISVTEPLVFDLALALNQKEYEVSVSGLGLTDAVINSLRYSGCDCRGDGWFVENITKEIRFVIIGATVQKDNPELVHEYGAQCTWEPLSLYKACWIECDNPEVFDNFKKRKAQYMSFDREGRDVYMVSSMPSRL